MNVESASNAEVRLASPSGESVHTVCPFRKSRSPVTVVLTTTLLTLLGLMFAMWLVSLPLQNSSIVDPFWGSGFVIVAWVTYLIRPGDGPRSALLVAMATVWGLRLSLFLLWRNWGHGEDPRYAAMRRHHGAAFWWRSFLTVFVLQGVLLWWIAFPLQFGIRPDPPRLTAWDLPGLILFGIGLFFESVGDLQLTRFKAEPANRGRVLDTGLWRYTRHPNYFGDFCVWWGIYWIAARGGAWGTFASPLLMSFFLIYVSGVRLTEQTIHSRRPDYEQYKRRTNAFFPGPPRGT